VVVSVRVEGKRRRTEIEDINPIALWNQIKPTPPS
jgi:hypothetical protein